MTSATKSLDPLFLAHGAPTLAIRDIPAHRFLRELGPKSVAPRGIVILSPHWETAGQKISAPGPLKTIHDFRGFSQELHNIQYDAVAEQSLVDAVAKQLNEAGIAFEEDASWGLDHGAWVPLSLTFPAPEVPIVALSLPHDSTPRSIQALGKALHPLGNQGILLIGSGSTTHNLSEIKPEGTPPPDWVLEFDAWLDEKMALGKIYAFDDMETAPHFRRAHPTEEHLLPVFFAMGAGGDHATPRLLHRSYDHGTLSMSYYRFSAGVN
ncbi:DODA-type extradiol aromatic ring-opening family dioxygenase [Roseibium hamelinense]|uniref:DODA-type extradiol aromatic ring-opening family dioxygenase n=1 Tax=Roseibium hamelinense TaxID=150831 RepID=UPI001AD8FCDE|nr:class III extradiol ring-cleavage dioxygenase [Roseibium hamelinense]